MIGRESACYKQDSMTSSPSAPPVVPLARNRAYMTLIAGQFVSRAGDALLSLASVWLLLDLTNNNALVSTGALAFEFVPYLLFGLIAGVAVDRCDRRKTMIGADLLRGAIVLLVPLLHAAGALRVWHIFLVLFLLSSLGRLFNPARQALMPDLVAPGQLVRANAIAEGSGQAAWIVGPTVGGVLLGEIGAVNLFALDAASFFVSAVSLAFVPMRTAAGRARTAGLWGEALGGIRHVRATPVLGVALAVSLGGTVAFAPVPALLPVLVREDFAAQSRAFGVLVACFFAGAVAGSTVLARRGARLHRGRTLAVSVFGAGIATTALATAPSVVVAAVVLALLGGLAAGVNVAEYSLLQTETPPELRGRVFAVANVATQCLRPPALIAAGLIADRTDARTALGAMAVAAILPGAAALPARALRGAR